MVLRSGARRYRAESSPVERVGTLAQVKTAARSRPSVRPNTPKKTTKAGNPKQEVNLRDTNYPARRHAASVHRPVDNRAKPLKNTHARALNNNCLTFEFIQLQVATKKHEMKIGIQQEVAVRWTRIRSEGTPRQGQKYLACIGRATPSTTKVGTVNDRRALAKRQRHQGRDDIALVKTLEVS